MKVKLVQFKQYLVNGKQEHLHDLVKRSMPSMFYLAFWERGNS